MSPTMFGVSLAVVVAGGWALACVVGVVFLGDISRITTLGLIAVLVVEPLACAAVGIVVSGRERIAWWLLAAGGFTISLGYGLLLIRTGSLTGTPAMMPSALAVPWLLSAGLHIAAAHRFLTPTHAPWGVVFNRVLDLILSTLFVTLVVFGLAFVVASPLDPDNMFVAPQVYAFLAVVAPFGLLIFVMTLRPKVCSWHVPLIVALALTAFAEGLRTFGYLMGASATFLGAFDFAPWALAGVAIAVAAIMRLRGRDTESRDLSVIASDRSVVLGIAATGLIFMSIPFFIMLALRYASTGLARDIFTVCMALLGMSAITRNLVVAVENAALRRSSTSDPLTGLYNHRFFHERLKAETSRAERERTPLSVIVFDLDDFDRVNNVYGHGAGDRCLQAVSERLASAARPADVLCRVGGDEFALIMPDTDPIEAYKVALRAQARVAEEGVAPSPVGLSAGIAGLPTHASTREQLVARADGALYWAKFHGREQIVIYDPDLVTALGPEQRIELLEEEAYLNMVQMLASAVDARDSYTQRHSRNVADLAMALARECGLDDAHVRDIETAALLHDVGKIGVPDAVLGKPGRLTAEERTLIEGHPDLAGRILGAMPKQQILPWITAHHERLDGQGFPDGLSGDEIPFEARIIALCDAYDAMTTDRPYRTPRTPDDAVAEILANVGTQFDPVLIPHFIHLLRDRGIVISDPVGHAWMSLAEDCEGDAGA